jgi:hypothetical protein
MTGAGDGKAGGRGKKYFRSSVWSAIICEIQYKVYLS